MFDVRAVRSVLSRIRRVRFGDPVMPEDHNDQTEAIAKLTDVVEMVEDPRDTTLDYILLKKQLSVPTWWPGGMWYQHLPEVDRHELRLTPLLARIETIYPPDTVYSEFIDLIPINYDPPLNVGRIWYRGDIPEIRFSPDGLVAYRLWPERYFPTDMELLYTDSVVVDPYYMPVDSNALHHARFNFPYTFAPGHILMIKHRITTLYDSSRSWHGRIYVDPLDPYTGYSLAHMGWIGNIVGLVPSIDINQSLAILLTEPLEHVLVQTWFEYQARIGDPPFPIRLSVTLEAYKPTNFHIQY